MAFSHPPATYLCPFVWLVGFIPLFLFLNKRLFMAGTPIDIQALARGDEKAFQALFVEYYPVLISFGMKYVGVKETVEDLVQDVFVKIWETRESLKNIDDKHLIYVREDEFDSKRELYADVKDAKLNARIAKIYKKFDKKKKYPCSSFKVISLYDCETGENERLAYDCAYPEKKALKLEMKEVLRR